MSLLTGVDQVRAFRVDWRVRCPATGRSFPDLVSAFDSTASDSARVPLRYGRFRSIVTLHGRGGEIDRQGTKSRLRTVIGGRVAPTLATGYLYETLTLLGPDGHTVVDTCRTGRIGWALRVRP